MFSRRHPFLFFFLVMTAIVAGTVVLTSIIGFLGGGITGAGGGSRVGIVEVTGPIYDSRKVIDHLRAFREDSSVKAIVVRIDSPGGGVGPSQEIYREIEKIRPEKKVISSMGSVAASGGYYVAAATDGIVANPGTITGSIGVIMGYTNIESLMQKIGLSPVVFKSGELKDMGSPVRPLTDDEKKVMQGVVDEIHRQFVRDVSGGRKMEIGQVEALADGRIMTGETALEKGLVDRMGNLEDAVSWARELAGLDSDAPAVYPPEEPFSFFHTLAESRIRTWIREAASPSLQAEMMLLPGGGILKK